MGAMPKRVLCLNHHWWDKDPRLKYRRLRAKSDRIERELFNVLTTVVSDEN